jgi:hypothetical protein
MGPSAERARGQRHWIAITALATLLAILVAASQTATAGSGPNATTAAKKFDFGDAPDGAAAGYEDDPAVTSGTWTASSRLWASRTAPS